MVFQFGCLRLFRFQILLLVFLFQLHRLQGVRLIEAARDPLQDVFLPEPPFLFRCRWR